MKLLTVRIADWLPSAYSVTPWQYKQLSPSILGASIIYPTHTEEWPGKEIGVFSWVKAVLKDAKMSQVAVGYKNTISALEIYVHYY